MNIGDQIIKLYDGGMSYQQIKKSINTCDATIAKYVKGRRTHSDACELARQQGRGKLTEAGRLVLSEFGKQAVKNNLKFWTKPERDFKALLNKLGVGVRFPDYVKEIFDLQDDEGATINFQYPIQRYVCDFVDINRRLVFRINGDYWHANPILYKQSDLTKAQISNIRRDKNAKLFLERNKWTVIDIWQSEIDWAEDKTIKYCSDLLSGRAINNDVPSEDWSHQLRSLWFKKSRQLRQKLESKCCKCCGNMFQPKQSRVNYCSVSCSGLSRRKVERPSKDLLAEKLSTQTKLAIAREFGVSDKAVAKWAKQYGLVN